MFAGDEVIDSVVTSGLFILQTLLEYRRIGWAISVNLSDICIEFDHVVQLVKI